MEITSKYNSYEPKINQQTTNTENTNKAEQTQKAEQIKEKTENIEVKKEDNKQEAVAKALQTYQASGNVTSTNFPAQPIQEFIA